MRSGPRTPIATRAAKSRWRLNLRCPAGPGAWCWPVDAAAPSEVVAGDAEGAWAGLPGLSPLQAEERCCRHGRLRTGRCGRRGGRLGRAPTSGPPGGLRNSAASKEDPPGGPCPTNQVRDRSDRTGHPRSRRLTPGTWGETGSGPPRKLSGPRDPAPERSGSPLGERGEETRDSASEQEH
ncbi:hypothetical protein NDU88_005580 [Pleurodeles waltl]|uniref:Uncharacterized protein n=1 Tax=Pleurodeles waltl TaxID=8319 RepID=A0AAV7RLG5_PLEWA|nr:hypothetical protein NDU88_005580 [Pleurodeles waltl]